MQSVVKTIIQIAAAPNIIAFRIHTADNKLASSMLKMLVTKMETGPMAPNTANAKKPIRIILP